MAEVVHHDVHRLWGRPGELLVVGSHRGARAADPSANDPGRTVVGTGQAGGQVCLRPATPPVHRIEEKEPCHPCLAGCQPGGLTPARMPGQKEAAREPLHEFHCIRRLLPDGVLAAQRTESSRIQLRHE
jgi:hypothetical protein